MNDNQKVELDVMRELMQSVEDYIEVGQTPDNITEFSAAIHVKKDITVDQAGDTVKKGIYFCNDEMELFILQNTTEAPPPPFSGMKVVKAHKLLYKGEPMKIANLVWAIYAYMDASERVQKAVEKFMGISAEDNFIYPSSPILHFTNQILNSFGRGKDVRTNKNTDFTYNPTSDDKWIFESKNKKNQLAVTIDKLDLPALKKNNKGLKKMFAFLMIKGNEQGFAPEVSFPLQDLVDCKMYTHINSARRGAKDNIDKIMAITIEGTTRRGKKIVKQEGGKIVYHYKIKNSEVIVFFNPQLNISFLAQYFTILPPFAFSLSNNAFTLLEYIFYLARQNTASIKEKGTFNIGLEAIRDYLQLPNEEDTQKHSQYIKDPIEAAITEIEEKVMEYRYIGFTITPYYDDNAGIKEYLKGYLQIGFSPERAQPFIDLANKREEKLKQYERRQEKAVIMAKAKHMEKQMEAEAKEAPEAKT